MPYFQQNRVLDGGHLVVVLHHVPGLRIVERRDRRSRPGHHAVREDNPPGAAAERGAYRVDDVGRRRVRVPGILIRVRGVDVPSNGDGVFRDGGLRGRLRGAVRCVAEAVGRAEPRQPRSPAVGELVDDAFDADELRLAGVLDALAVLVALAPARAGVRGGALSLGAIAGHRRAVAALRNAAVVHVIGRQRTDGRMVNVWFAG